MQRLQFTFDSLEKDVLNHASFFAFAIALGVSLLVITKSLQQYSGVVDTSTQTTQTTQQ